MKRTKQRVFEFRGIIHVPKYQTNDAFVGPGYGFHHSKVYTSEQLKFLGAKEKTHALWEASIVKGKQ